MVVKFAQLRSIFHACQTESAVAVCGTRQSVSVRRSIDPKAGLLEVPPPLVETSSVEEEFVQPPSQKGTRVQGEAPSAADYTLDRTLPKTPQVLNFSSISPTRISAVRFLSLLQQKHRDPRRFVCIDLSGSCSIKFSLVLSPSVVADISDDVTILIYGFVEPKYNELISFLPAQPRNILILDDSTLAFLAKYPFCYQDSLCTMPGPTEILYRPEKGMCLYISDLKTTTTSVQILEHVFDIRFILNLSGASLSLPFAKSGIEIIDVPRIAGSSRGGFYSSAVKQLLSVASKGLPILVNDLSGCCHAPAVAALFLILLGWTPENVVEHVISRRGEVAKRRNLFDCYTLNAIRKYCEYRDSSSTMPPTAPDTAVLTSVYPLPLEDVYDNDAACVVGYTPLHNECCSG